MYKRQGLTEIPYFIASTTNGVMAEVWVKVASLPALDTATIFMYYKNGTATTTSSSTTVFIAADDFEDGGISEYSGDTSLFAVDGSFAYGGANGIDNTGNETSKATNGIGRFDQTVSQGEIIRFMQYVDTVAGSGDEVCTLFGVQLPITVNNNYAVCLEQFGTDRISIVRDAKNTDSSGTLLASSTVTYQTGWYEVEIDWKTNDTINVELWKGDVLVATTSVIDSTYTSGGYGFTYWFNNGGWDNITSRPRVDTEPIIRYGVEQTNGGASWSTSIDTSATSFSVGEISRLRIAIENTGLSTSDAYRLEFAEQGGAPSCESVGSVNYATVQPSTTCGSDPVCMEASPNVLDGIDTSDLLISPNGNFTMGKFVEDPSNTTASLTLDQGEYTEVEYTIKTNNNVTDQNLCFRVTDAGSDLDTYIRVAKLKVKFDPSLSTVTFNDQTDITLTLGTTTRIYATSTATDLNGYTDLVLASSTMYRSGVGAACIADNNNCYISTTTSQCNFTNCSGNSCDLVCYSDIFFHADPTDAGTYVGQDWYAFMEVEDQQGGYGFETSADIDLITLRALTVLNNISYGSLEVNNDTGSFNPTTTIQNIGNDAIDIEVDGTNLTDGGTSQIPSTQQLFATTTFTYSTCVVCLSVPTTTPVGIEVDLSKPLASTPPVTDVVYWGIAIPFGTASNPHQGTNIMYAVGD